MKRIAAITMLRNDPFFLQRWVEYYGGQLGRSNLYVFFDGLDQAVPSFCEGVHTTVVEHMAGERLVADRLRIDFLSQQAASLFAAGYEAVIGTDVDEFLVVDPLLGKSLPEFLSGVREGWSSVSGLGIDVGQMLDCEERIGAGPLLSQRSYAYLNTRYSKASTIFRPVAWGSGFHRIRSGNFHILPGLYLFHFGCVDIDRIKERMGDALLQSEGWEQHLKRRSETISIVGSRKAREFDSAVAAARRIQNLVRPPYAWNKPSMLGAKVVVRIPERFSKIV